MPDSAALRRRAYEQHVALRALVGSSAEPLIAADALLDAAQRATDIVVQPLPEGDPLLAGAQAFLDRDSQTIWYARGPSLSPERQRFALAHEFAHYWLHPEIELDAELPDDSEETYSGAVSAAAQVEEGYSPQERREREANLFAAELLLPSPLLRDAVVDTGQRASDIMRLSGLSESCVLAQLAAALLLPLPKAAAETPASEAPTGLDPSQRAAAEAETGPLLVDAGPGTGKTRTLTARILHLIRERAVPPEQILALTFSNRAAEEMSDRLFTAIGATAQRVWVGTFHAFGFDVLRKDGHRIGLPTHPVLIEPADAITLLERNLDLLGLREYEYLSSPTLPLPDILDAISRAKDELKSPADYLRAARELAQRAHSPERETEAARAAEVARVYEVYEALLRANGLVDYGDMIARAVELLEACPDVRERWRRQYPQILADEYQDVNRATARLLQLLAGDGRGFWAVGDLRQAIYRFRGASPANIRQFETDFPGGRRLSLGSNYRSRPGLVRLVSAMAGEMNRETCTMWEASRGEGAVPALSLAVAADEEAQADWLAAQIRERCERGVARADQAVLAPTNRHAAEIAEMLETRGIAVQVAGSLLDRPEIKDLLALLSLASEPDGIGLVRVAGFAEYAIPAGDALAIIRAARDASHSFPGALGWALENLSLSDPTRRGLSKLCDALLPIAYRGNAWLLLSRYLFETSGYMAPLLASESAKCQQSRLAIYQLLLTLQQMSARLPAHLRENPRPAVLDRLRRLLFLRQTRSVRVPDAGGIDAVRVMTIHQSKGLEFPVVYLPNLIKGQFPARGRGRMAQLPDSMTTANDADGGQAEELFFVALSRARDELLLARPATWRGKAVEAAPLLFRIEQALAAEGAHWTHAQGDSVAAISDGGPPGDEPGGVVTPSEHPGQHVESEGGSERPDVSLSRIRQYQACPRQYYYRHVARLPERGEEAAYRTFDRDLRDTLSWIQQERAAGRTPSTDEAQAQLRARWPEAPPEGEDALSRLLRGRAVELIARARDRFAGADGSSAEAELTAELESGVIRLRADEMHRTENGRTRIAQHVHRRPRKDDHTAEHLALLRLAARQADPQSQADIEVFSTATGETREVKEDRRWEPHRVAKYEAPLRGLAAGDFAPKPSEAQCASCPFFFICPS
jgi:DNA helicase II / ATP-dependent DNA helicase PcrA